MKVQHGKVIGVFEIDKSECCFCGQRLQWKQEAPGIFSAVCCERTYRVKPYKVKVTLDKDPNSNKTRKRYIYNNSREAV